MKCAFYKKGVIMGNLYEIKLADGDRVTYESDMTLDELKQYISQNDFIEIPRSGTVPYGNNGIRFVPTLASYQTKSIVYIDHDTVLEECREHNNKVIEKTKPIVDEIFNYEFNKRIKRWLWWNISSDVENITEEDLYFYNTEYLKNILKRCKKYKCKLKKV